MQAFKVDLATQPGFAGSGFGEDEVALMAAAAREKLATMCESTTSSTCVLSAEDICTFTVAELGSLKRFIDPLFDSIDIILYVRPLKDRMESGFQEILKTRFRAIDQRFPLNYMRLALNFDEVFNQERVHFFKFAPETFPDGDIVTHFLAQVGAPAPAGKAGRDNSRMSKEAVQLLYAYRKYFTTQDEHDAEIVSRLEGVGSTPFHFHSALFRRLLHTGKNASARFEQRAGFSIEHDIQANDAIGIKGEEDLLAFPAESIRWLSKQLTLKEKLKFRRSRRPDRVAQALRSLVAPTA